MQCLTQARSQCIIPNCILHKYLPLQVGTARYVMIFRENDVIVAHKIMTSQLMSSRVWDNFPRVISKDRIHQNDCDHTGLLLRLQTNILAIFASIVQHDFHMKSTLKILNIKPEFSKPLKNTLNGVSHFCYAIVKSYGHITVHLKT